MCNMAAYTGKKAAAPILFRMIKSQEFLDAGHYTGIAIMDNGKICMRKVCGTAEDLLKRYPEILNFPGNCGIIHSRTPGIDNDEWSQPFFAYDDEEMVMCGNGGNGRFGLPDIKDDYCEFLRQGKHFRTAVREKAGSCPMLPDGHFIHVTEFKTFVAKRETAENELLRHGLKKMFCRYPSEIAALAMRTAEPGAISVLRNNMPMMLGRKDGDFYLATSAVALESEKISWIDSLPYCSVTTVSADSIQSEVVEEFAHTFRSWQPLPEIYREFDTLFDAGNDYCFDQLRRIAWQHWDQETETGFANQITYEYLRSRLADGSLECFSVETPASHKGGKCFQNRFRKK